MVIEIQIEVLPRDDLVRSDGVGFVYEESQSSSRHVVHEIVPHLQVLHHGDTQRLEVLLGTNPAQHEELGGVYGASGHDDLSLGVDGVSFARLDEPYSFGPFGSGVYEDLLDHG